MFSLQFFLLAMTVIMGCHLTHAINCKVIDNVTDADGYEGGLGDTCHCVSQEELMCSCGRNVRVEPDDWRLLGKESLVRVVFDNCLLPNITAEYFERYIQMSRLILTNAQIETIDEHAFSNSTTLQNLEITEIVKTGLSEIPILPSQLKSVVIMNTNISVLDTNSLPANLSVIMLDKNPISHIPSQFKDHFTKLHEFRCLECDFAEVPTNLPSSVEWLVLPGNHIVNITEEAPLPSFTGLMHLNLNNNGLTHIWKQAYQNIHTRGDVNHKVLLLLYGNQLTYLSDELISDIYHNEISNVSAINVDLNSNPLNCNCRWTWLLDQQFQDTLSLLGHCSQPEFLRGRKLVDLTYDDFQQQNCDNLPAKGKSNKTVYIVLGAVFGSLILMAVIVLFIFLVKNYFRKQQTTSGSKVVNLEAQERGL